MGIERIQKKIHLWIYQESVLWFCTRSIQPPNKQQSTIEEGHQAILWCSREMRSISRNIFDNTYIYHLKKYYDIFMYNM